MKFACELVLSWQRLKIDTRRFFCCREEEDQNIQKGPLVRRRHRTTQQRGRYHFFERLHVFHSCLRLLSDFLFYLRFFVSPFIATFFAGHVRFGPRLSISRDIYSLLSHPHDVKKLASDDETMTMARIQSDDAMRSL